MATPVWQPGTLYPPGFLVQPLSAIPAVAVPIPNAGFESGNVEWDTPSPWAIINTGDAFEGTWSAEFATGFAGTAILEMDDFIPVNPGTSITGSCQVQQGASSAGNTGANVFLRWYDSSNVLIAESAGNVVDNGSGGAWHQSTVTATAPANTAFVRIGASGFRSAENLPMWVDNFAWNLLSTAPLGLIFKAVQPAAGVSADVEPVWPSVVGVQVVDNEVIWEAVLSTRITWEAQPILVSGATEPAFPAVEGATVSDGSIKWVAVSRRVTDPNCPNSKVVAMGASKIFAGDDDIVAYCATVNPLDWSSANNAGYLPVNLQQYGGNPVSAMGLYRGNLVPMNSQGSQVWQIDEDPAQMALLDAFPVGSTHHQAVSPAFNDLFFLPGLGVRTIGIAGGSTNLQAGDAGMPIDPLVQEALRVAEANGVEPMGTYLPAAGQYWLIFSNYPVDPPSITGNVPDGTVGDASSGAYVISGGVQPYSNVTVLSGTFPTGLTLNPDGTWSGTRTTPGNYSWTAGGTDADGNPFAIADTSTVLDALWWVTNYGSIALENDLYISQNPLSFGAATTRTPNIEPSYGPKAVALDVVLVANLNSGTVERITDMVAPVTTTLVATGAASVRHIRVIDDIVFVIPRAGTTYRYSLDKGETWLSGTVPGSPDMADIARLENGRWLTLVSGLGGGFYYSDAELPTVAGDWTSAGASNPGGGGHADGYIAVSGNTAVSIGVTNIKRTTDGATWGAVVGPGDTDRRDGTSINGVFLCLADQDGSLLRSTDGGLTWTELTITTPGEAFERIETGGDIVVACTNSGQMWVSSDDGANWAQSTTPGANGKRATFVVSTPP